MNLDFIVTRPCVDSKTGQPVHWDALYVGMRAPGCFATEQQAADNAAAYFAADERLDRATNKFVKVGYDWRLAPGRIAGLA